jgi:aspartyl protease family protein
LTSHSRSPEGNPGAPVRAALSLALVLACTCAAAQTVSLQGMLGRQALLIVDGAPPKGVAPGESYKGVKVVSTAGDEAVVEIGGQRHTLHIGEAPASVGGAGAASNGTRIVITASNGGHFVTQGRVNGQAATLMVDTGATLLAMSAADAQRLGIDYRSGQPAYVNTANGQTAAWRVKVHSVRIGDVEVFEVDALVSPQPMPQILLGNSYLNRFQMKRDSDQMVLERRF